ncbi:P-loop NTPase family protein [Saccharicrinis fermentans]|uniref:hypothetical protein n=1 Tax=Saccharicrinis fermentans TaxID=982 RepID=UPI001B7F85A5|nr:hypothetical protein [Saccharicrinis fermentans]
MYRDVMGMPETNGIWLVYGKEKNGKTTLSLMLAEYLSTFGRTMYISAEEGIGKTFVDATERAKLRPNNRSLIFYEYVSVEELISILSRRQSPHVAFLDNMTIYNDELKAGGLKNLVQKFPNKLL